MPDESTAPTATFATTTSTTATNYNNTIACSVLLYYSPVRCGYLASPRKKLVVRRSSLKFAARISSIWQASTGFPNHALMTARWPKLQKLKNCEQMDRGQC